jgi:hypothetical protein
VSATKGDKGFIYAKTVPENHHGGTFQEIETKLRALIKTHDYQLACKCFGLCRMLGIDYVSIEGYWDPVRPRDVLVVDLDLPFDVVFMASPSR